jgi:hypothetical protein
MSHAGVVNGNTGIGYSALTSNSTGTVNTGIGYLALERDTSGSCNTALGFQTLWVNTWALITPRSACLPSD